MTEPIEGEAFDNDCMFSSLTGNETAVSGLNVPVIANPNASFGFEIRGHGTV